MSHGDTIRIIIFPRCRTSQPQPHKGGTGWIPASSECMISKQKTGCGLGWRTVDTIDSFPKWKLVCLYLSIGPGIVLKQSRSLTNQKQSKGCNKGRGGSHGSLNIKSAGWVRHGRFMRLEVEKSNRRWKIQQSVQSQELPSLDAQVSQLEIKYSDNWF